MHLTKKFATAIAVLIESNYGEFVDIMEQETERDLQGYVETVKDPGYAGKRRRVMVEVDSLLMKLVNAK